MLAQTGQQSIGGVRHVHLAVAQQDVAIAAEHAHALVICLISAAGIEKGPMGDDDVEHVRVLARGASLIPAEDVEDVGSTVLP